MKFMLSWSIHKDKRQEAFKGFSQMTDEDIKSDIGDNIQLIGRWHDMVGFTGVAIFETDDANAIANFALNWNSVLDATVTPVLDDDEARKIGQMRE